MMKTNNSGNTAKLLAIPLMFSLLFSSNYKTYAERCQYCFPKREIVRRYSSDNIKPVFSVKTKRGDRTAVEKILYVLENVPDAYQKIVNDYGAEIIIFDGKLSEISAIPEETIPRGYPEWVSIDDLNGIYEKKKKKIFMSQSIAPGCDWDENECIALHEYGHAVHEALGRVPGNFMKIHKQYKMTESLEDKSKSDLA
ncbi:MAG: hypothetical protein HZB65_00450, partial [Candidatus Aenigmarchaeota archaeon]|nr:hypothetical protein [Candidatus Aenigmarchaeota archaeon]